MSHSPAPQADDPQMDIVQTNVIGEVEMLVSGAALFSMLKLPGWLRAHLLPLGERLSDDLDAMVFVLYAYLATAAIVLAITFALHLTLRARWIALVGLRKAFPAGVRWKRLAVSATLRGVIRRRDPGASAAIRRASTLASIVFASGLMLATIMLVIAIAAVLALVLGYVAELAGHPLEPLLVFITLGAGSMLPMLIAALIDKLWAGRAPARGRLRRALAHVYGFYARVGLLRGFSVGSLLQSHGGEARSSIVATLVMLCGMLIVAGGTMLQAAPMYFGSYASFPHFDSASRSPHVLYAAQYADQRDPLEGSRAAYIQSRVITGAWLVLTLPYEPSEDGQAIARECPKVAPADDETRPLLTLQCLTRLHAVSLDGQPLPDLRYQVAIAKGSRRPVLVAMIDVRDLAPGRHELTVQATHDPHDEDPEANKPWLISFWT